MSIGAHKYISISSKANKQSHNYVLESLCKILSHLSLLRCKTTSESKLLIEEIYRVTERTMQQLKEFEDSIQEYFRFVSTNAQPKSWIEDHLHGLTSSPLHFTEKNIYTEWKYPIVQSLTRKILPQLSELFSLAFIKFPVKHQEERCLYYFKEGTSTLASLDIESRKCEEIKFNQIGNKGNAGTLCLLPRDRMFYGGGFLKGQTQKKYFVINKIDWTITQAADGRARKQASACYRDSFVYVFGGCEGDRAMKFCDKLNIDGMKWETFCDLPSDSDTTIVEFDGKTIVSGGLMTSLYIYDYDSNFYIEILGNLPRVHKFLCCGNGRAYLFCGELLYCSDQWNPWKWSVVKDIQKLGKYWIYASIRNKDCIYFTTGHYTLFQENWPKAKVFNLTTQSISEIF